MNFLPTGPYTITLTIGVILGAILAFTGKDRRLRWPAGAMLLSLVAARAATAFPEAALGLLFVSSGLCAYLALVPAIAAESPDQGPRASRVIAAVYVLRLLCYAANAFNLLDRAMMWEFSNAFLIIQIGALFAGTWAGGHKIIDVLGSYAGRRSAAALSGAPQARRSIDGHN